MSHPLFLQGQAVFLILRTPALEAVTDSEDNLRFQRRPLAYLTRLPPCLCRKSALGPERSEPVRHASRACIISSHREERFALFAADGGKDLRWSGSRAVEGIPQRSRARLLRPASPNAPRGWTYRRARSCRGSLQQT